MITKDSLDFLKINKQSENADLYSEFHRIATVLFEQFVLVVNGTLHFTLVEIEFYFLSLWHQDFFTYGYPEQKVFGEWFRHPAGMDLTFGDPNESLYAGVLLRSIREDKADGKFINGSINVRDALSNKNSKVTTQELRNTVALYRNETKVTKDIFISSRIGISEKSFSEHLNRILAKDLTYNGQANSSPDIFIKRKYRFITDVCPKNKFRDKIVVAENSNNLNGLTAEYINCKYDWKVIKV